MLHSGWLILLLPLAVLSGWFVARRSNQPNVGGPANKSIKTLSSAYYRGLNFLLNEQSDKAITEFQSAIDEQDSHIEVQLALGNLFRRAGEVEKATLVHQSLIGKTDSEPQLHAMAQFELAQDYQKAGLLDRAETIYLALAAGQYHNEAACVQLLQIYEQQKDWARAVSVIDGGLNHSDGAFNRQKSHYYCELAQQAMMDGQYDAANASIKCAADADKDNIRPVIESGNLYWLMAQHEKALKQWQKVIDRDPFYIRQVIDAIAGAYKKLNRHQALNSYLEQLIEKYNSTKAMMLLSENILHTMGGKQAHNKLAHWLRANPCAPGLRKLLEIKLMDESLSKPDKRDLHLLCGLLDNVMKNQKDYQCRQCGFSTAKHYWRCPGCKTWSSIIANRPSIQLDV